MKPGVFFLLDVFLCMRMLFDTPHSFSQQCLKYLNIFDIFFLSFSPVPAPFAQTSSFYLGIENKEHSSICIFAVYESNELFCLLFI